MARPAQNSAQSAPSAAAAWPRPGRRAPGPGRTTPRGAAGGAARSSMSGPRAGRGTVRRARAASRAFSRSATPPRPARRAIAVARLEDGPRDLARQAQAVQPLPLVAFHARREQLLLPGAEGESPRPGAAPGRRGHRAVRHDGTLAGDGGVARGTRRTAQASPRRAGAGEREAGGAGSRRARPRGRNAARALRRGRRPRRTIPRLTSAGERPRASTRAPFPGCRRAIAAWHRAVRTQAAEAQSLPRLRRARSVQGLVEWPLSRPGGHRPARARPRAAPRPRAAMRSSAAATTRRRDFLGRQIAEVVEHRRQLVGIAGPASGIVRWSRASTAATILGLERSGSGTPGLAHDHRVTPALFGVAGVEVGPVPGQQERVDEGRGERGHPRARPQLAVVQALQQAA